MIEDGIAKLVQGNSAVAAIAPVGGFYAQLPDNLPLPSWTFLFVGGSADHTLLGARGPRTRRLQVDAYGDSGGDGSDAVNLSAAIDAVLDGYSGALTGSSVGILSCLMEQEPLDFFDDAGRTYRRMTEYTVVFG